MFSFPLKPLQEPPIFDLTAGRATHHLMSGLKPMGRYPIGSASAREECLLQVETKQFQHKSFNAFERIGRFPFSLKLKAAPVRRKLRISCAILETAASVAVAATIVGAAATFLVKRTETSQTPEALTKVCDSCGGSGICPECRGEGFVLKKLSEENAEKARLRASDAATRYTAGLPRKWSYCTKCSSTRSCRSCGGSGKLSF